MILWQDKSETVTPFILYFIVSRCFAFIWFVARVLSVFFFFCGGEGGGGGFVLFLPFLLVSLVEYDL